MVNIKHVQSSRRRHLRMRVPIWIHVGEHRLDVVDWSLGGFRARSFPDCVRTTDGLVVVVTLPFQGFCVSFEAMAREVRRGPERGELAAAFVELQERSRRLLDQYAQASVSGELAPVEGLISSHENPRALAGPSPALPEPAPSAWAVVRTRASVAAYIITGIVLAFFLGARLYNHVWRLQVSSAAVLAPTELMASPEDGVLEKLFVTEGQRVGAQEPLFRVAATELKGALTAAEFAVDEAELALREGERALDVERRKLAIHGRVVRTNLRSLSDQADLMEDSLSLVSRQLLAAQSLVEKRAIAPYALEQEQERAHDLKARLSALKGAENMSRSVLKAAAEGYYYQGDRLEGGIPELSSIVQASRERLELKRRQLEALQRQIRQIQEVNAPFGGRVSAILQSEGTAVKKGNTVMVLTQDNVRRVEAWVSNIEASYLRIGDTAVVEVPGVGASYVARIHAVDTNPADIPKPVLLGVEARTRVLLEIIGSTDEEDEGEAMRALVSDDTVGLPATVTFQRVWR